MSINPRRYNDKVLYESGLWGWGLAFAAGVVFFGWYRNWRGPLRPDEIQSYLVRAQSIHGDERNDVETMRRFLEADDGREFVMLNLVKIEPGPVPDPETGELVSGSVLLNRYTKSSCARSSHEEDIRRSWRERLAAISMRGAFRPIPDGPSSVSCATSPGAT
ncbi:MAG: hypothetical protein H5U13_11520 [Parvibaculum sp.]|nr:hypothetical protein [Parvibaculum sp.]